MTGSDVVGVVGVVGVIAVCVAVQRRVHHWLLLAVALSGVSELLFTVVHFRHAITLHVLVALGSGNVLSTESTLSKSPYLDSFRRIDVKSFASVPTFGRHFGVDKSRSIRKWEYKRVNR